MTQTTTNPATANYTIETQTRIYQGRESWVAQTNIFANGFYWHVYTSKAKRGGISTMVTTLAEKPNGQNLHFGALGCKNKGEEFRYTFPCSRVTETSVKEAHTAALNEFNEALAGEAVAKAKNKPEIGTVIYSHGNGNRNERAIFEIIPSTYGTNYKTVLLDGSGTRQDSYLRHEDDKFGIGTYYTDRKIEQAEIDRLLPIAREGDEVARQEREAKEAQQAEKAKARREYRAKFQQADTRKTSELIKSHILKTWPEVSAVYVKTDKFSGGDSVDITYHSPERITAVESWVDSLQEGRFNGMNDCYEYSEDADDFSDIIIVDGCILQKRKYAHTRHVEDHTQRQAQPTTPTHSANGVHVTLMSAKGGIEIKFNVKPDDAVLNEIRSHGFRWSRFNRVWWANQSASRAEFARSLMGENEDGAGGMVQANEDAGFDNFCQQNNI